MKRTRFSWYLRTGALI